jgi:hypothetical protein
MKVNPRAIRPESIFFVSKCELNTNITFKGVLNPSTGVEHTIGLRLSYCQGIGTVNTLRTGDADLRF